MRREASRATPERARLYPIAEICKRVRSFSPLARLRKFEYKVSPMRVLSQKAAFYEAFSSDRPFFFGSIMRMLIRIRQKTRIFRRVAEISAARPGRGLRVTPARTSDATGSTVAEWVVRVIAGRAVYR